MGHWFGSDTGLYSKRVLTVVCLFAVVVEAVVVVEVVFLLGFLFLFVF